MFIPNHGCRWRFDRPVVVCVLSLVLFSASAFAERSAKVDEVAERQARYTTPLDYDTKTLAGKQVNLAKKYSGKVVLLVNVASKCGLTPQYEALQELHDKYAKGGLAIVGVPCNQFRGQEPGTAKQIIRFCQKNYGVTFDLLEKQNVKLGKPDQSLLYQRITAKKTGGEFAGDISWNFEKFLFNRQGEVVARFSPRTKPMAKKVVKAIETQLAKSPQQAPRR